MKIDRSTFASLKQALQARQVGLDELEAMYYVENDNPPLSKDSVIRVTQYLQSQHETMTVPTDMIDITDARSGIRATLDVAKLSPTMLLLPLPAKAVATIIHKARLKTVGIPEYRIRINLKRETPIEPASLAATEAFSALRAGSGQLTFRLKRRYSFTRNNLRIDMTAVRMLRSATTTTTNIRSSVPSLNDVACMPETYEMEVEWIGPTKLESDIAATAAAKEIMAQFSVLLKLVDGTVGCILSVSEHAAVVEEYKVLGARIAGTGGGRSGIAARFIGPKPITLELEHLRCNESSPCIERQYTVTPKADGERRLLFVSATGRVYTISDRLGVMDTSLSTKTWRSCILDGEHIVHLNEFLVFDAYAINGDDIMGRPLMLEPPMQSKQKQQRKNNIVYGGTTRLGAAAQVIADASAPAPAKAYRLSLKEFRYIAEPEWPLDEACRHFFRLRDTGKIPYEVDGLVFTPALEAVPQAVAGRTWGAVMKWKPPEMNTIDFQVQIRDRDSLAVINGTPHALIELLVGQDPWMAKPLTAYAYLTGEAAERMRTLKGTLYAAVPFAPDGMDRSTCYIPIEQGGRMRCLNGDEIIDGSVVEFAFDAHPGLDYSSRRDVAASWRPLRMRWDKTSKQAQTGNVTANKYVTANAVWRTIRYPITQADLESAREKRHLRLDAETGKSGAAEGTYYVAMVEPKKTADAMRRFHNIWVKRQSLLLKFPASSGLGRSVYDFGCGTGGDLSKWIEMGARRVMGIDKFASNLYNPDLRWKGAYVRLLQSGRQTDTTGMRVVFLPIDASKPFATDNERRVYARTLLSEENGDRDVAHVLWNLVDSRSVKSSTLRTYMGYAAGVYDLAVCMFAIHYFFDTPKSLSVFARNVASVLRPGGHFIGCCLDGDLVDAALLKDARGEGDSIGGAAWRITRRYPVSEGLTSFNRQIDVYMKSIGQQLPESLVSFTVLQQAMAEVGLFPPSKDKCKTLGLSGDAPTGTFRQLFEDMQREVASGDMLPKDRSAAMEALKMSADEKRYSFLNRWFVFESRP